MSKSVRTVVRAALRISALILPALAVPIGEVVGQDNAASSTTPIVSGQGAPEAAGTVDLPRLAGPVTLDGFSDEAAWAAVEPVPLTMYEPTFRGSTERTIQVLVAYDKEALYVAARFYHDDPDVIRAFSLTRDRWAGDDGFGIFLDTFNDNENALRFVAMPLGTRMDMSVSGDGQGADGGGGQGGGPRSISWNAFWDLETQITDQGWFGEMRIPLSSLRFEADENGDVVMGMMAYAYEPGEGTRWTFPAIPREFPYTQVSAWQDVRLQDVASVNPVYFTPYGLTGRNTQTELNAAGDGFTGVTGDSYEVGADIKINPTPNLTFDLTVNTDFAAVEADQQQVNLTRFSLFFDEKRPFFQERAGIFSFDTGAERGTLFYSRRIGLADGEPVRIHGGARLVGRVGAWDLGVIEMQTAADNGHESENFGVLRLRRRVLNSNSFLGGMATSRIGADGLYNATYGVDSQFRVGGNEYITLKWLQTFQGGDDLRDAAPGGLDAGRIYFDWTRRQLQGFSYRNAFIWSGPGYDPAVGFESRNNFTRAQSDWNYQWFPGESSRFRRVWTGVESNAWVRNEDDRVDTGQFTPFLQLETKPGASIKGSFNAVYEDVSTPFALGDEVTVPIGSYWAPEGVIEFRAPRGWTVRPNITATAGRFFDGTRLGLKTDYNWSINSHLELRGGWEWNRIRFAERGQEFDSHLARLTAQTAVNSELSMNAFVQFNSLTDQITTNARFRYNFSEGQDLWFVWNEGLNFDRPAVLGVPRRPIEEARTLTVKYTHTLIF